MSSTAFIELIVIIVLIYLSSYFSGAETALTTVSRVRLKTMADEGDRRAERTLEVLADQQKMLSAILIMNNIVNLSSSSLFTTFVITNFDASLVSAATAVLSVAIIIFGEITPKNMATLQPLERSMRVAPVIGFLMKLLTPVIFLIDQMAGGVMKLLHVDRSAVTKMTEGELRTYVEVGREQGVIEGREKRLIYNVFDFGDSTARDIMTPRVDMTAVASNATYDEILETFRRDMFTRLPVYEKDDPDHIIGIINIKDFIFLGSPAEFENKRRSLIRSAYYTYEYKKTAALMREMQKNAYSVSLVLDEYGNTVGMITLEDLVEEIVGDIRDEYDDQEERAQIHRYDACTFLVESAIRLDDLNDRLGTDFDSEDYDTIGGLIIEKLDRLPRNNEAITLEDGTILQVKGIRHNRIIKVLIRFTTPPRTAAQVEAEELQEERERRAREKARQQEEAERRRREKEEEEHRRHGHEENRDPESPDDEGRDGPDTAVERFMKKRKERARRHHGRREMTLVLTAEYDPAREEEMISLLSRVCPAEVLPGRQHPARRRERILSLYLVEEGLRLWQARHLDGESTDAAPAEVPFTLTRDGNGKPSFTDPSLPCLSISHSGDEAAVILCEAPVGLDLQGCGKRRPDVERLCRRYFPESDQKRLQAEPDHERRLQLFLQLWTIREAFLKLTGEGLGGGLDSFVIEEDPQGRRESTDPAADAQELSRSGRIQSTTERTPMRAFYQRLEGVSRGCLTVCTESLLPGESIRTIRL